VSLIKKSFGTAFISIIAWFWYLELVDSYWETVSIKCQPNPVQVICHISNKPDPGGTNLDIPKTQLTGVKYTFRAMEGNVIQGIVLTTIDEQEIPLHRNPRGKLLRQLIKRKAQIAKFIADPQAKNLTIETQPRDVELSVLIFTGGMIIFGCLLLKKMWMDVRTKFF
jgi:hypothetical protein